MNRKRFAFTLLFTLMCLGMGLLTARCGGGSDSNTSRLGRLRFTRTGSKTTLTRISRTLEFGKDTTIALHESGGVLSVRFDIVDR